MPIKRKERRTEAACLRLTGLLRRSNKKTRCPWKTVDVSREGNAAAESVGGEAPPRPFPVTGQTHKNGGSCGWEGGEGNGSMYGRTEPVRDLGRIA